MIGDSVNLGSRLEGLSKVYGVDIVVSETTRKLAPEFAWQELDRVRVKGKEQAVAIFWPLAPADRLEKAHQDELKTWAAFLKAYRAQDWDQCDVLLLNLQRMNAKKYLYELYSERVASMRLLPFDPDWDGATNFETKVRPRSSAALHEGARAGLLRGDRQGLPDHVLPDRRRRAGRRRHRRGRPDARRDARHRARAAHAFASRSRRGAAADDRRDRLAAHAAGARSTRWPAPSPRSRRTSSTT